MKVFEQKAKDLFVIIGDEIKVLKEEQGES